MFRNSFAQAIEDKGDLGAIDRVWKLVSILRSQEPFSQGNDDEGNTPHQIGVYSQLEEEFDAAIFRES